MHEELLSQIGLTKSEIAVYLALLELGSTTTGPIIKKAGTASGKAYIILDKLILKGLVTYVIRNGIKYYHPTDPERILDYLKEKQYQLQEKESSLKMALPTLRSKYVETKYTHQAEIYEGTQGLKSLYDFILGELKKGEEVYILGVPKELNERFEPMLLEWNQRRIRKGVKMKVLYNYANHSYGRIREKMRLTEVRYNTLITPAQINIFKDYVGTVNPHGTPVCFLIRNKETSESYRKYFELLWKQAKK